MCPAQEEESEDEAGSTVERVMEGLIDHGCYVNRILPGGVLLSQNTNSFNLKV